MHGCLAKKFPHLHLPAKGSIIHKLEVFLLIQACIQSCSTATLQSIINSVMETGAAQIPYIAQNALFNKPQKFSYLGNP